jgi:hypothetical protein
MIRVIRFTIIGILVLALGLGPIGCGGENTTSKGISPAQRAKKEEAMKKVMEEKQKGAAGAPGGKADEKDKVKEDKPKSGDNDK